jgi:hypothetical protein
MTGIKGDTVGQLQRFENPDEVAAITIETIGSPSLKAKSHGRLFPNHRCGNLRFRSIVSGRFEAFLRLVDFKTY